MLRFGLSSGEQKVGEVIRECCGDSHSLGPLIVPLSIT